MFRITSDEQQGEFQGPWRKERTYMKLQKDQRGLEQRKKSKEDVKPQKIMRRNIRQPRIIAPIVVTCHIPSKLKSKNNFQYIGVVKEEIVVANETRKKQIATIGNSNSSTTLANTT